MVIENLTYSHQQPKGGVNRGGKPLFRAPRFESSGAFLAYLWAVKDRPRREGKADYSLKLIFSKVLNLLRPKVARLKDTLNLVKD